MTPSYLPKIKVCGLRDFKNIQNVSTCDIEYLGFIFYKKSKRFVRSSLTIPIMPSSIKKVGVFVNQSLEYIIKIVEKHDLDMVQLHGDESSHFCKALFKENIPIIKAFGVDTSFDFESTRVYEEYVNYFLFDTKTVFYGGSGRLFSWEVLKKYDGSTLFFLSGGIGPDAIKRLSGFFHEKFHGIDVNSCFEVVPGQKDIEKIHMFADKFKYMYHLEQIGR